MTSQEWSRQNPDHGKSQETQPYFFNKCIAEKRKKKYNLYIYGLKKKKKT